MMQFVHSHSPQVTQLLKDLGLADQPVLSIKLTAEGRLITLRVEWYSEDLTEEVKCKVWTMPVPADFDPTPILQSCLVSRLESTIEAGTICTASIQAELTPKAFEAVANLMKATHGNH